MDDLKVEQLGELFKFAKEYDASMTAKEAAAFLKVGINELYRYANNGLPYYMMGNGKRFAKADLIAFRDKFKKVVKI